jgi:hypothetical protein
VPLTTMTSMLQARLTIVEAEARRRPSRARGAASARLAARGQCRTLAREGAGASAVRALASALAVGPFATSATHPRIW